MEKVSIIRDRFRQASVSELAELTSAYENDERAGVAALVASARKKIASCEKETARLYEMLSFERKYSEYGVVCGMDEAGRGPLAGPVAAAAVVLYPDVPIPFVNDSKQLSAAKREILFDEIMEKAMSVGVGIVGPDIIDDINILQADYAAMREAFGKLSVRPDVSLNDAVNVPNLNVRQISIIKGDAKSLSIAAASIIAKVTRDRIMLEYDRIYPQYGFAKHKGYGTAEHIAAIRKYGPCPIHRRTFIGNFI